MIGTYKIQLSSVEYGGGLPLAWTAEHADAADAMAEAIRLVSNFPATKRLLIKRSVRDRLTGWIEWDIIDQIEIGF